MPSWRRCLPKQDKPHRLDRAKRPPKSRLGCTREQRSSFRFVQRKLKDAERRSAPTKSGAKTSPPAERELGDERAFSARENANLAGLYA
jgi:hypothetical protein